MHTAVSKVGKMILALLGVLLLAPPVLGTKLAKKPPMGWSSWNSYHSMISEDVILSNAKAMKKTGLLAKGYSRLNIDGGESDYT